MEGDFIKINKWLLPLSWLYGFAVWIRNQLFESGVFKSRSFETPIISVGNITVGGSGKTPLVEYIVEFLGKQVEVAVLSRGYKRKTKGFVEATTESTVEEVGDELLQMKRKFPNVTIAACEDRCDGIERLTTQKVKGDTDIDVVVLDDAFQHRHVKPGINILLTDYHRLFIYDKLLPAGRLREHKDSVSRADIVIVTKCPKELKPLDHRVITKSMSLYPYQTLLFSTLEYDNLRPMYCGEEKKIEDLTKDTNVLLLTAIASPLQLIHDLSSSITNITQLTFSDHHNFTQRDLERINRVFEELPSPKMIITTEKDATRLFGKEGLNEEVRHNIYILPVKIKFMLEQDKIFNQIILSYVQKNSRNSTLVKAKDDHKPQNSNNTRNGVRTISFRNN